MSKNALSEQKIGSSQISVVIQGPLHRNLEGDDLALRAVSSIKKHLPEAEIIISTWPNQNTNELPAHKIIISEEPPHYQDINGNVNNITRQIVSTRAGIEAASRPYVLKYRADLLMLNSNITFIREYSFNTHSKKFFRQPITVTNLFIRNPLRIPMLFHLSDLIQFGRREDLLDLWSIELPNAESIFLKDKIKVIGNFMGFTSFRQFPEQTLVLGWLKKHDFVIDLPESCYTSYQYFKLWETLLIDHFYVMNWQQSGIEFPKRFHAMLNANSSIYTEADLAIVRKSLSGYCYPLRYLKLLINKYITCWFRLFYLRSIASLILFSLSPKLAKLLRSVYRCFVAK